MRHVVVDAYREVVSRVLLREVVEHRDYLRRVGVLRREAVAPADDDRAHSAAREGGAYILIERPAVRAHFLAAVEDGDFADALRNRAEEVLDGERTEKVHLHVARFASLRVEVIDGFFGRAADGAHRDDDFLGVWRAVVVEEVVLAARYLADLRHVVLDDAGQSVVEAVVGLAHLEVDVGVLHGAAHHRVLGVQRLGAELRQRLAVEQRGERLVGHRLDLVYLVRGAEAVEEVHEGDAPLYRREVRDAADVHDFLHAAGRELREAALAAVHDVGVVAENREGVRADGARGDVEHAGVPLSREPVKHGDHQHEPLRRREGRGERAGLERAVNRGGGSGLGLHLYQSDGLAEDVFLPLGRPCVGLFGHRRGGRYRIYRRDFGEGVGDVGRGLVAVHRYQMSFVQNHEPLSDKNFYKTYINIPYSIRLYHREGEERGTRISSCRA